MRTRRATGPRRGVRSARSAVALCALVALVALVAACGDDEGAKDAVADTLGEVVEDTQGGGDDLAAGDTVADPDVYDDGCAAGVLLTRIEGVVHDEGGAPLAEARPQPCLRDPADNLLCLRPPTTAADGLFGIDLEPKCWAAVTMRVLVPETPRAIVYCQAPMPVGTGVLSIEEPIVLAATTAATTLPPIGDATASRTVVFEGGLELDVIPDAVRYSGGTYEDMALVTIDPDAGGLCFYGESDVPHDALFAFSPEADVDGAGLALRLPNLYGYAPGQAVALEVLGGLESTLADGSHIDEGEWVEFGQATVSQDGAMIEADASQGLPSLTWLGIRGLDG